MNLVSKSSFLFHSKNVMRLGVMLVICSLLVNMVCVPKAKAVAVVDDVAVGAVATAAYLTSTGIPLTVTAGGASAVSAGIVAVAGEYAAATGAAASGEALLGTIAAGTALTTAGAIVFTAAAAAAVGALAYWVYDNYSSGNIDLINVYELPDCGFFVYDSFDSISNYNFVDFSVNSSSGTFAELVYPLIPDRSLHLVYNPDGGDWASCNIYNDSGKVLSGNTLSGDQLKFAFYLDGYLKIHMFNPVTSQGHIVPTDITAYFLQGLANHLQMSADVKDYTPIPEIAPAKQLELDIAAPPELELADLPEFAMEKVAAGDWSQPSNVPYSVTSVDPDPVPDPDPDPDPADPGGSDPTVPDDTPDIDDLGLPDLGAALTTRFPFSIPWDIYRGLKLLSAPAEVPKFEVDFFAPLNNRVGGWKGDTKIVIDFGYYPEFSFIGELCRWTSTIGYCLFLAAATKRFIWTA